jgi:hypothetical protein
VPRIVKKILKTAPNVRLRVVQADSQHVHSLLEGGEVDLAIEAFPLLVKGIRKQRLFSTSYMGLPAKTTPDLARHPRFKNLFGNNKSPSPPLAAGTPIKGSNGRRTGRCATTTRQSRYCWTYRSLILLTSDPPMNSEQSTGHRPEVVRRRGRPVRGCPRPCGHRSSAPWASSFTISSNFDGEMPRYMADSILDSPRRGLGRDARFRRPPSSRIRVIE